MEIQFTGTLIDKKESEIRGNNFEIQPFLIQVGDSTLYLEAVGMYSGIGNGINIGDIVMCKAEISSNQRKDNPNKYWTNINLTEMKNNLDTDEVKQSDPLPIHPFQDEQKKENDLPF
tara:strand:- start:98 stop:448 length:351 start_codon:yes stop_codon:yes gene_type:complete